MLLLTPYQPMLALLFGTKAGCLPSASSLASPRRSPSMSSTRRFCDSIGLIADTTLYYLLSNNFIVSHIQELRVLANLPGQIYCFPMHMAATDERPDIVIWNGIQCTLVELIVPAEDNFADTDESRERLLWSFLHYYCIQSSTDNDSGWVKRSSGLAIYVLTQADVHSLDFVCCVPKAAISGSCLSCRLH